MNRKVACSRLLNDGSFLVANDEADPAKFYLFIKWNSQCHETEIKYNADTEKYSIGSVGFDNVADLIFFYKENQLPVNDLGAILLDEVSIPKKNNTGYASSFSETVNLSGRNNRMIGSEVGISINLIKFLVN